jgi:hypothetical protein
MKSNNTFHAMLSGWSSTKVVAVVALFVAAAPVAFARSMGTAAQGPGAVSMWNLGESFTFLFVALGPLNVVGPFAAMTQGRPAAFKRRLAFRGFLIAAIALLFAATLGAKTLQAWGISVGALLLTAGAILFQADSLQCLSRFFGNLPAYFGAAGVVDDIHVRRLD